MNASQPLKTVILAGGLGTRLSEETVVKPKPMVEIGGFFVLDRKMLDNIDGDQIPWEQGPMARLIAEGQLMAYRHDGYWQPTDTLREKHMLETPWWSGHAPWKVWS